MTIGRSVRVAAVVMVTLATTTVLLAPSTAEADGSTATTESTAVAGESGSATSGLAPMEGSYTFHLTFDGLHRDYRLHVPPAASTGKPLPLVLNLHGATQNGLLEELQTGMDNSADQNGYLVAYPDGTRISKVLTPDPVAKNAQYGWNAGQCCGLPVTKHINDVGFLEQVIADIAKQTPVDLRRVYMTGISNGGMMAYAMASEASDHVAAISSISGQVELPTIHPSRPVATLEFHSLDDPIAKWVGVPNKDPRLRLSVMEGINQWVKADGCNSHAAVGTEIVGASGSISAGETATPVTYQHCRAGTEVALWRFTGSGHVWPGSLLNTGPKSTWILDGVGRGTVLVDANEAMWRFFQRYQIPAGDVSRA